jgi:uncharacterized protein (TIGR00369 family)
VNENPARREIIEAFIPNSPHAKQLGIRVVSLGTDEAVLELPFKPELATIGEVVHGGAIGALIDTAAMAAAWATDEVPESVAGSTVSLGQLRLCGERRRSAGRGARRQAGRPTQLLRGERHRS